MSTNRFIAYRAVAKIKELERAQTTISCTGIAMGKKANAQIRAIDASISTIRKTGTMNPRKAIDVHLDTMLGRAVYISGDHDIEALGIAVKKRE